MNATVTGRPATDKQQVLINKLLGEKETTGTAYEGWVPNWSAATTKTASVVIDYLLTLPHKTEPVTTAEHEAGVYTDGTNFIRVYLGQQSGKMLAKTIMMYEAGVECTYAGLADRVVTSNFRRMSLEEIGSLGRTFDHCVLCGRRLDNPESVDLGIGPVCAKRY